MPCRTVGPDSANIMLVGEAPGEAEMIAGVPFVGYAGRTLDSLLKQAGLLRHELLITNVAREAPPAGNIGFFFDDKHCTKPKDIMRQWILELKEEIELHRPNIVVALGSVAFWALTGIKGITAYRGCVVGSTLVPGTKVIGTYHPQNVNYEWKKHFPVILDLKKAARHSLSAALPVDKRTLVANATLHEFLDYCDFLCSDEVKEVGLDLETSSPGCHINRIGLGHNENHAMSIPVLQNIMPFFSLEDETRLFMAVGEVVRKKPIVVQNGSFDFGVLTNYHGIYPVDIKMDTHIAAHVVWPEAPRSLGFLASICIDVPPWKMTADDNPGLYNAGDVANMLGVSRVLAKELTLGNHWDTYRREAAQIKPAIMLQLQGMRYDKEQQDRLYKKYSEECKSIEDTLEMLLGRKINLGSPKQVQTLLYVDLALPVQYKRQKTQDGERKATVDAEAITRLSRRYPNSPLLKHIATWKKLNKLCTSFLTVETSEEGRVHTSYNITGATMRRETTSGKVVDDEDEYKSFGRWSSSKSIILPYGPGNLQNIPKKARKLYVPGPGQVMVQADYKQAEAVVVAYLINDRNLKQMFKDSFGKSREECAANYWDVHRLTASQLFGKLPADITKEERDIGKRLRHAISYSAGPAVLAHNLGIGVPQAKGYLEKYMAVCPQLKMWQHSIQRRLASHKTLENLLGRKHRFLERHGDQLFRSAYSFIPQSTVGDLLNLSLVTFYEKYGDEEELALQLHDAIYVICDKDKVERTMERMRECMMHPLAANAEEFYIDVDFSVGPNWGEMEEI